MLGFRAFVILSFYNNNIEFLISNKTTIYSDNSIPDNLSLINRLPDYLLGYQFKQDIRERITVY